MVVEVVAKVEQALELELALGHPPLRARLLSSLRMAASLALCVKGKLLSPLTNSTPWHVPLTHRTSQQILAHLG